MICISSVLLNARSVQIRFLLKKFGTRLSVLYIIIKEWYLPLLFVILRHIMPLYSTSSCDNGSVKINSVPTPSVLITLMCSLWA